MSRASAWSEGNFRLGGPRLRGPRMKVCWQTGEQLFSHFAWCATVKRGVKGGVDRPSVRLEREDKLTHLCMCSAHQRIGAVGGL
jgi:hypothetical protein